ncbi:cephalosporin hydroxylase family protein, partial [bacterium]|nr:cephalosporin hydroxylase family protein [bacterium]
MDPIESFKQEVAENIKRQGADKKLKAKTLEYQKSLDKYIYNFSWMGRPIIQLPQDIVAMQEIIWKVKPDLIIETGIAHGGSILFFASMMEMMGIDGQVLGLDIDIRAHNFGEIIRHPMYKRITMIEGSSTDEKIAEKVYEFAKGKKRILVCLDSNHTHEHVLKELKLYAPLVTVGSYCIVFDTVIEDMPKEAHPDRPWGPGNNPKTAVWEFLKHNDRFEIDKSIENKLLITAALDGYLKCLKS